MLRTGFAEQYRTRPVKWGFPSGPNSLGEVTFRRTYSRNGEQWYQTVDRVVRGVYQILADHCRLYNLPFDPATAQRDAEEMYDRIFTFKFLPPGRGLWMMGTDYVRQRGSAPLLNCLAYETEIITSLGTKKIGELAGQTVKVLTRGGAWVDAPIRCFGKQKLYKITVRRQKVKKDIYATANHRWFACDRRDPHRGKGNIEFTTTELRPDVHRLQYIFGNSVSRLHPAPVGIAAGFTYGDGNTRIDKNTAVTLTICGEKDRAMLKYFSEHQQTPYEDKILARPLPNFFKELPPLSENRAYLLGWLMGYFAADGCCDVNGQVAITSYVRANLEHVRDICYLLGIGTYSIAEQTAVSNLTNREHTAYRLTLMRETLREEFFLHDKHRQNFKANSEAVVRCWTVDAVTPTDREEDVYCATVEGYGAFALADNILTGNCAFVSSENIDTEFDKPFRFLMDMSMLGVGVGFDTRGSGKVVWSPGQNTVKVVIEDSREGWVDATGALIRWGLGVGPRPELDYSHIRVQGTPIKGFGGVCEGPEPLKKLHTQLTELIETNRGKPITSRGIVDIMNMIGCCVVAGNIRRTAEIAFGDPEDEEFLNLKNYNMNPERGAIGWASNNSIFATVGMDYQRFAKRINDNGEPGFAWLDNMRAYGRLCDPPDHRDYRVLGSNPCGEQSLEHMECCCLVESFPYHHDNFEDFRRTLKYAYLYAKSVTLLSTHWPETNAVQLRNRRIGTSISGVTQFVTKHGINELVNWCNQGYDVLGHYDRVYSEWLCVRESIKMSSVKPSGSVSLLAGATPGCHYPIRRCYIRRIRFAKNHPDVAALKRAGYPVEPDVRDSSTVVIEFPVKGPKEVPTEREISVGQKMKLAVLLQRHWADNQVSCTATFDPATEASHLPDLLAAYDSQLKSISFLPMKPEGAYEQMPYESITEEEYERRVAGIKKVNWPAKDSHDQEDKFCDGEACLIGS